jgi:hypothetical protein
MILGRDNNNNMTAYPHHDAQIMRVIDIAGGDQVVTQRLSLEKLGWIEASSLIRRERRGALAFIGSSM